MGKLLKADFQKKAIQKLAEAELRRLEELIGEKLPRPGQATVVQLAEHAPYKGEVSSSNPGGSTNKIAARRIMPKTDYTPDELYQVTGGFQDPDPPTSEARRLFEAGELEL